MKKRILIISVLCLLTSAVFFGCGQKSYFESKEPDADAAATPQDDSIPMEDGTEPSPQDDSIPMEDGTEPSPQEVIVKVYVYNDTDGRVLVEGAETEDKSGLVDINTADRDELLTLNGIGATRADAIISYRDKNGSFIKIEDIKNVSGIGDGTYEKIKDKITV